MSTRRWLASQTRRPTAVGAVVAVTAFVFSTLYLWLWPEVAKWVNGVPPVALVPLITVNAFLTTKIVWIYTVGDSKPISQKRLAKVGLAIGLLSHIGLGFIAGTAFLLFDENGLFMEGLPALAEVPRLVGVWVGMSILTGVYSILFTFGVPFVLSVTVSVVFARAYRMDG